ncbi:MAG: rhomboid family intramembrane serine protease [Gammaproteobacteria bacterium]|nr:rhomboid family intramembrane serine protease [Gammaproteobacteria bacterium]
MFIPVKADFKLKQWPVFTVLVCLVCFGVFLKQASDWREFNLAAQRYCMKPQSHLTKMVMAKVQAIRNAESCGEVMYVLSISDDEAKEISEIVSDLKPLSGFSAEDSRTYVTQMLTDELRYFRSIVPDDPDHNLAYYTGSWNVLHMISSNFAHGDWSHIIFNLIFFFAFAATVEALVGPIAFVIFVFVNSLIIGVTDSVVSELIDGHHWTLGLSGVVMGMMGLFAYLLPRGKIRCYYWFVILFGSVAVPGWILAAWFIGGDMYQLFASDNHGAINVLAHVAGGVSGYLYGFFFLKGSRMLAASLQQDLDQAEIKPGS